MAFSSPPTWLAILWCFWACQAAWCCWNVYKYLERYERWVRRSDRKLLPFTPPAALIVPIKGIDERFAHHLDSLLSQRYPAYRLIFIVQSESDPAWGRLQSQAALFTACADSTGCRSITILAAGLSLDEGQKVRNLLCGLRSVTEQDECIVFADADAVPDDDWLRRIIHPLTHDDIGATTGYRWLVPQSDRPNLPTMLGSIINSSIATLLGPDGRSHAWGGSMALLRKTALACKLEEHWRGSLSDDYQLTRAIRSLKLRILFVPSCLIASPVDFSWKSLMEFGRRQYLITRVYAPLLWCQGLLFVGLYNAAMLSALVVATMFTPGWAWSWIVFAFVAALEAWRTSVRGRAVKTVLGPEVHDRLGDVREIERFQGMLIMAVHFAMILASIWGRTIRWAGITYELRSPQKIRILDRAQ